MALETSLQELRIENVTRRFGEVTALNNMNLTIQGGEFIALLGPSGCGKSTALSLIAGLLPLSEGTIKVDGKRIDTLPPEKRNFGMVFQNYALFPHLSVFENVAFGLKVRKVGRKEIQTRVLEALKTVDLIEHKNKRPSQLSGGQQQRVAIARAIVLQPRLILMDEPLSNLDAKLRLQMRTEIKKIHQQLAITAIYVTHDQEEALALADRIVVLRKSKVDQVGTPAEVYARPVNSYVASFMGFRNIIPVDVVDTDSSAGQKRITFEGQELTVTAQHALEEGRAALVIRPEDFRVGAIAGSSISVNVEVVEFSGSTFLVEARTRGGEVLHMRLTESVEPGQQIEVTFAPEKALLFTGSRVSHEDIVHAED